LNLADNNRQIETGGTVFYFTCDGKCKWIFIAIIGRKANRTCACSGSGRVNLYLEDGRFTRAYSGGAK
jgi:hypothetical protein